MRRLMALSGGGVRGIIEIAFLEAVEEVYRARRGPETRLSDVFDLIGGTSTGSLIAAGLALGKPVSVMREFYLDRAVRFFRSGRRWTFGFAPIFDAAALEAEIRAEIGDVRLGDPDLLTYLAILMKRLDTGSPWIVSNIPTAPYYDDAPDGRYVGNRHYEVARLLRASTAAPTLFEQETIRIADGMLPGVFIDGGISPYNNPALAVLMLARMRAFGLGWPTGVDELFILSIGTGRYRIRVPPDQAARARPLRLAVTSLMGLMVDNAHLSTLLFEWAGKPLVPTRHNSEIGSLDGDTLFDVPLFSYLGLDVPFDGKALAEHGITVSDADLKRFQRLDDPGLIRPLYDIARAYCAAVYDLHRLLP